MVRSKSSKSRRKSPEPLPYSTKVGDLLVVWINGKPEIFIAEVTQSDPLQMKVQETGPYAHLKNGEFIVREDWTLDLQRDTCTFLENRKKASQVIFSGLKKINVEDGELQEIFPPSTKVLASAAP